MIGLTALALLSLLCYVTYRLARWFLASRCAPQNLSLYSALATPVILFLFVNLLLIDEHLARPKFNKLCSDEKARIDAFDVSKIESKTIERVRAPDNLMKRISGVLPIEVRETTYLDPMNMKNIFVVKDYYVNGGWLKRILWVDTWYKPFTFDGYCRAPFYVEKKLEQAGLEVSTDK